MIKTIELTKNAVSYLTAKLESDANYQGVYIALEKAGCAGYMYKIKFVKNTPENCISEKISAITIHIPPESISRLQGSTLDYQKIGIERKAVFKNPNVTLACGCGDSVELINKES